MTDSNYSKIFFWFSIIIPTAIGIASLIGVFCQLMQSNELKRYENFIVFNKIYDDWYANMPQELKSCKKVKWHDLENDDIAWIRRYFNLYAQEYYFYKKGMIPKEMWEVLIHGEEGCKGGAIVNLHLYPILMEGYEWWKSNGAFNYPSGFTCMLDEKISECKETIKKTSPLCK